MSASRQGIAVENLKVVSSATGQYPAMGKVTREYKTVNQIDGTIEGVALDELGREIDVARLQQSELAAREALERGLDAPLARRLANARRGELIEVAIWLKEPAYRAPARPAPGSSLPRARGEAMFAQVDRQRSAFVKAVVEPFAARLRGRGFKVKAHTHAPLVHATLPPEVIEELRASKDVDRMYLPVTAGPTLKAERMSIHAHVVNNLGITGAGVPVAAVEVGGQLNTANPFLAGVTQDLTFSCPGAHAAAVAGIIRSADPVESGVAPGANLWVGGSCGGSSAELEDRSTAAAAWGARALNLSFGAYTGGVLTELDRYYDSLVIHQYRTVVPAAGNDGNAAFVRSPGSAYNVITVGAYDEQTNLIAGFSGGLDPGSSHGDREKPEVAAPGVDFLSTLNASPWTGSVGSGTSYAAPMATGTAALMMQRNPTLQFWPEAVRAIMMATATRNIEGATRLSELDGAGGIFADYADDVTRGVYGGWGGIGYDCSAAPTTVLATMSLVAGHTARVVISYDTDPSYGSYGTQPSADLDLLIKDPSGSVVAVSASYDNTYEIVELVAGTTGTFTIEVSRYRCDLSPRWLGYAYFSI
ncbi:MAG TPA: S8 family serine peptidase [Kofleriaceae bacterium]|nr:S8 family serine peptidase [Kofleriaceae bacterium]